MTPELHKAFTNIEIVVASARMTLKEHEQLQKDIQLIKNACCGLKDVIKEAE